MYRKSLLCLIAAGAFAIPACGDDDPPSGDDGHETTAAAPEKAHPPARAARAAPTAASPEPAEAMKPAEPAEKAGPPEKAELAPPAMLEPAEALTPSRANQAIRRNAPIPRPSCSAIPKRTTRSKRSRVRSSVRRWASNPATVSRTEPTPPANAATPWTTSALPAPKRSARACRARKSNASRTPIVSPGIPRARTPRPRRRSCVVSLQAARRRVPEPLMSAFPRRGPYCW